jgi:hypothetical protein
VESGIQGVESEIQRVESGIQRSPGLPYVMRQVAKHSSLDLSGFCRWNVDCKFEKFEVKVYANQEKSLCDLQILIKHSFLLNYPHKLLITIISNLITNIFHTDHAMDENKV